MVKPCANESRLGVSGVACRVSVHAMEVGPVGPTGLVAEDARKGEHDAGSAGIGDGRECDYDWRKGRHLPSLILIALFPIADRARSGWPRHAAEEPIAHFFSRFLWRTPLLRRLFLWPCRPRDGSGAVLPLAMEAGAGEPPAPTRVRTQINNHPGEARLSEISPQTDETC